MVAFYVNRLNDIENMKRVNIGGQAVLEGVMMKGPKSYALAVRKPNKEIEVKVTNYLSLGERYKALQIPIIRGIANFLESLYIGMKTLMDSSEMLDEEENTVSGKQDVSVKESGASNTAYLVGTLIVSLVIAVGVFMLLPAFLANFLYKVTENDLLVNLAEGILRLLIFLGYVIAISFMEDIKRTYMYHGAEHKTINCMEAGDELTVENVKKHTRFHKRCGTSFVFIVMFISIVVFMFVKTDVMWMRLVSRVVLIPVIAGISYEFIRYAGKHNNVCSNVLSAPGLWVQRLTTREPDDSMIEVAIKSVEGVIDWHEYVDHVRNNSFEL
ncbi:Uncharacterized conserved protein YqhQ [Lachnospiraceae bacterium NE2001]|nr:Uncharacterized conserved protein YqhQ [Lachnospiraceae bacterium NE2001]